jgi:hypothetical protein
MEMVDTGEEVKSGWQDISYEVKNENTGEIVLVPIRKSNILQYQLVGIRRQSAELPVGNYILKIGELSTTVSVQEGKVNLFWIDNKPQDSANDETAPFQLYILGVITSPYSDPSKMTAELYDYLASGNSGMIGIAIIYLGYYGDASTIDVLKDVIIKHPQFEKLVDAAVAKIKDRVKSY